MAQADGAPRKRSPLHHVHASGGALTRDVSGWEMAYSYRLAGEETAAVGETGGLCDVSHLGKLAVQGEDAVAALRGLFPGVPLAPGDAPSVSLPGAGGRAREVRLAVLAGDEALVLSRPSDAASVVERVEAGLDGCAHATDVTSTRAGVRVLGPRSHAVLSRVVELDVDPRVFPDGRCLQGRVAEIHGLVIRADAAGVLGYLLFVTRDYAEHLWAALLHAGEGEGVAPVGLDALETTGQGVA